MKVCESADKELVKEIRKQLKENNGYCPCALIKDENTKCMCADFREKIKNQIPGECICGLFEVIV